MLDFNDFKRSVKEWIRLHPGGSIQDLRDFCEERIPSHQYSANEWLVDQTISWYRHILAHREYSNNMGWDEEVE